MGVGDFRFRAFLAKDKGTRNQGLEMFLLFHGVPDRVQIWDRKDL